MVSLRPRPGDAWSITNTFASESGGQLIGASVVLCLAMAMTQMPLSRAGRGICVMAMAAEALLISRHGGSGEILRMMARRNHAWSIVLSQEFAKNGDKASCSEDLKGQSLPHCARKHARASSFHVAPLAVPACWG